MNKRIINLTGLVNEISAINVIIQLLNFNSEDQSTPIYLYINSPGGSIQHGLAIYDTIEHINAPVYTICTGLAASMGAFLLSCGHKGNRYAFKHSRILIHQPLIGNSNDIVLKESEARQASKNLETFRQIIEEIIAKNTNKNIEKIHQDCERDNWLNADDALAYGLIDFVV